MEAVPPDCPGVQSSNGRREFYSPAAVIYTIVNYFEKTMLLPGCLSRRVEVDELCNPIISVRSVFLFL